MTTKSKKKDSNKQAMVQIPLSAIRCISSYPKDKIIICEISTNAFKTTNATETLDEIINESRIDYALGKYKTFKDPKKLIAELRS